jgi:hypothetical protein
MDRCINISHPEFKELVRQSNINPLILKSKVGVWQEKNNTDKFPTLEQLGVRANINVGRINSKQDIEGFKEFDDKSKIKGIGRVSVKNGVAELFESNPELANSVYEALVPNGYTRLYRSEDDTSGDKPAPDWVKESQEYKESEKAKGRWFYKTLNEAINHSKKFGSSGISYIDVLTNEVEKYNARDNKFV